MREALTIVLIILDVIMIGVLLLQARGGGFGGGFGSSDSSIYRTRRGFERTLFQFTIILAVLWVLLSIAAAMIV
jgi:preprotein translocase subunit SecG